MSEQRGSWSLVSSVSVSNSDGIVFGTEASQHFSSVAFQFAGSAANSFRQLAVAAPNRLTVHSSNNVTAMRLGGIVSGACLEWFGAELGGEQGGRWRVLGCVRV